MISRTVGSPCKARSSLGRIWSLQPAADFFEPVWNGHILRLKSNLNQNLLAVSYDSG